MNKLIIGLGNPGTKYEKTRHNLGFLVLDTMSSTFKVNKKLEAAIAKKDNVILAKPLTFMNDSGRAIIKIAQYYKISIKNIFVIHDDKDLNFGTLRIKTSGSAAGHNGIKSIIENLKTENFSRCRLGVKNSLVEKMDTADFVLANFSSSELKQLPAFITDIIKAINTWLIAGPQKAMNLHNKKSTL